MSRRSDPARIDDAHKAATRNRLIGDHVTEATADDWIAAWEARAAREGLARGSAYWEGGLAVDHGAAGAAVATVKVG